MYHCQAYMVEAEGLKEKIKTSKTSSSTSGTTISSMLFGTRKSVSKTASSAPAAIPSDCFDYTAESRLKRSEATPIERRESSGSATNSVMRRLSGAKSSPNSPTVRRTSVGASGNESAKESSAPKKSPPPLSEYEKQIMSGTPSRNFYALCVPTILLKAARRALELSVQNHLSVIVKNVLTVNNLQKCLMPRLGWGGRT